jgi:transketolase
VLPAGVPRVAVEMGVTDGWWKYGCAAVVGIDTYGESAPAPVLFKHFGFTEENVADTVLGGAEAQVRHDWLPAGACAAGS